MKINGAFITLLVVGFLVSFLVTVATGCGPVTADDASVQSAPVCSGGHDLGAPPPPPPPPTTGHTYYLSPSGSDGASGDASHPLQTIEAASSRMTAGDVALLGAGTYVGFFEINASGTAAAPITFRAAPGAAPLIEGPARAPGVAWDALAVVGSYVVVDGLRVTNDNDTGSALSVNRRAHDVTVNGCELYGAHGQGLMISGDNVTVEHNRIHDNGSHTFLDHGIYVEGGGATIRYNEIFANYMNGIQLYNGEGVTHGGNLVRYNYIFGNGFGSCAVNCSHDAAGIVIADGQPGNDIRYNKICGNAQHGILAFSHGGGNQIHHNVTCYNRQGGIWMQDPGAGDDVAYNISLEDELFALSSNPPVDSDGDIFYRADGKVNLRWQGSDVTLANFQSRSGLESGAQLVNPQLKNVGADFRDVATAESYDFCTPLDSGFCN